ncbi:MFS transporter, partial [Pseudonocardia sp. KRD-169]|nr:MFS transporter [Pseudonocardia abyssalis]
RWARRRRAGTPILLGFGLMSAAFLLVAAALPAAPAGPWPAVGFVVLLTAGQMLAGPVAQALVPVLAAERRLGAYFGVLSSAGGLAVLVGSTAVGALLDVTVAPAATAWLVLAAVPLVGALVIGALARRGALHG